ncbi:hypothetical protein ABGV42_06290 [Paenibacillus pabuli]
MDPDHSYVYEISQYLLVFLVVRGLGWDESRLTEDQQNGIDNAVKLIERKLPFDGCDFHI